MKYFKDKLEQTQQGARSRLAETPGLARDAARLAGFGILKLVVTTSETPIVRKFAEPTERQLKEVQRQQGSNPVELPSPHRLEGDAGSTEIAELGTLMRVSGAGVAAGSLIVAGVLQQPEFLMATAGGAGVAAIGTLVRALHRD